MSYAFLGGTCAGSNWRERLIPLLQCEYVDPVVATWTPEAKEIEDMHKQNADLMVYVITPQQTGFYSFIELLADLQEKRQVVIGWLEADSGKTWRDDQRDMVAACLETLENRLHLTVHRDIQAVADAVNQVLAAPAV